jgi:biotin carboxylase
VTNQHNYDELVRALGFYTHQYGKIDRLESHNEYWLESDARLRTDFNIPGFKTIDLVSVKRKSEMKAVFHKAGIPCARGRICHTLSEARLVVEELGFPLVVKPDVGVGASHTYKITNTSELEAFFDAPLRQDFIFEEFILGKIQTFDGLVDQNGQIVFSSSLEYSEGVMDLVNRALDFTYFTLRKIPTELAQAGRRLVKAYNLRERFFHFEFFCSPEGKYVALEVNMRPPGGLTVDMWNYANDINIFDEYANVVVNNHFGAVITRPYFCAYVGRRRGYRYLLSNEKVMSGFSRQVVSAQPISGVFAAALGDFGYLIRSPEMAELQEIAGQILKKA